MSVSVGEIGLDLIVNRNGFDRQMRSVQAIAAKAGMALAAAFSVKKLVDFSKKCIELGSDLAEVQNVVDVTFPEMTEQVDKFAKSAAVSFGLSETMAKQYTGTFGAMAKAFGFTERQAYDMGTTLTGLAGDVASFYNLSQDEAYTKLKSVFTGETESLKDLGVVMTQTALDSYALANGWGKTTNAMSEAEKVALQYAFVQNQLSAAQGDFARTADSWANQVRILKLQIDSIMATVGQGLINLLTPVIKIINIVLAKIATLANTFKAFTELLTGNKSSPGKGIEETTGAAEELEDAASGVGSAAEKAAKKMKGLMSFDKLNNIQTGSSGSGESGGGSVDFGSLAESIDEAQAAGQKINPIFDSIIKRLSELWNLFKSGFKAGLGDWEYRLESIKESISSIKESLTDIFTDQNVIGAADKWAQSVAYVFGSFAGSAASIGLTIGTNLLGGISKYLEQNKGRIKDHLVSMFDIWEEINQNFAEFFQSVAYVFEAFASEDGQQLTANIIGIFADAFMGLQEIVDKAFRDLSNIIIQPFVENKEGFRTALEGFLGILSDVTGTIKQGIDETVNKLMEVYDGHYKPLLDSVAQGLSDTAGKFLEFWNSAVQPVLEGWAEKFDILWKDHIQPFLNKFLEFAGSVYDLIKVLWENILKPFIDWIIGNILPVVMPVLENLYHTAVRVIGGISDIFSGLFEMLRGIIDFLTGVFSGDWAKAFDGITMTVTGAMNAIKGYITSVISVIGGFINDRLTKIKAFFEVAFNGIKSIVKTIFDAIRTTIRSVMDNIRSANERSLNAVKAVWNNVMTGIKNTVTGIFQSILNTIGGAINKITGWINDILGLFGKAQTEGAGLGIIGTGAGIMKNKTGISQRNVNIPQLASGGIITSPTLAMIGENHKKEAIVPLERNLGWRDAIADKVAEKADARGTAGIGLTADEMRAIMAETVTMFARLIEGLDIRATYDKSEVYKAVRDEYKIASNRR